MQIGIQSSTHGPRRSPGRRKVLHAAPAPSSRCKSGSSLQPMGPGVRRGDGKCCMQHQRRHPDAHRDPVFNPWPRRSPGRRRCCMQPVASSSRCKSGSSLQPLGPGVRRGDGKCCMQHQRRHPDAHRDPVFNPWAPAFAGETESAACSTSAVIPMHIGIQSSTPGPRRSPGRRRCCVQPVASSSRCKSGSSLQPMGPGIRRGDGRLRATSSVVVPMANRIQASSAFALSLSKGCFVRPRRAW